MFALQHASGIFMPAPAGRAGGTYVDPFTRRKRQKTTPRLFARRSDASSALDWWLKGEVQMSYTGGWEDPETDYDIVGQTPVASRVAAEWRVVEVKLEIIR